MKLFDVYPVYDIDLRRAEGAWVWDAQGQKYLDMYGGHAVISIGHTHPHYVKTVTEQLHDIGFYSNSVVNSRQQELAEKLGKLSGKPDYRLFLCNSVLHEKIKKRLHPLGWQWVVHLAKIRH